MNEVVTIGDSTLYCGDALEILHTLRDVGVVITDPPYGCKATTGWGGAYDKFTIQGDDSTFSRDETIRLVNTPYAMFGSPRIDRPEGTTLLIWAKGEHTGMGNLTFPWKPDFEEIYIKGEGWRGARTSSVLRFMARIDSSRYHPTEKPIPLMEELVSKAPQGTVLDPFMGSGSTGVACMNLGRKFIGIEIERKYFDIACRRIDSAQRQASLFDHAPVERLEQASMEFGL